jgi:bacterioferritin-associated ferredoxin
MIVCSCNVLSDAQVKSAVASGAPRPRMSSIYASLGCAAKCGRCTRTIKTILEDIGHYVAIDHHAIEAIPVQ